MSRAPRPIQTANPSNALPPHVMSNMHLASAMGVSPVPSVMVQSPVTFAAHDPNTASMMPVTYNAPMQYETQHIPVVDFKAGVNPVNSMPVVPQQTLNTQVPTQNPYGVSTTPSISTESPVPSKEYLHLSRQLRNIERHISEPQAKLSSPYIPKGDYWGDARYPDLSSLRSHRHHPHHHHYRTGIDELRMKNRDLDRLYDSELHPDSRDNLTTRLNSVLDKYDNDFWR
jgi:hypothetical protein